MSDLFTSVEDVWCIWLISGATLAWLIQRSLSAVPWSRWRSLLSEERGASYALPYLMIFPFYLLMMCCVVQGSMILIVKIGVMHAAHMAARSAVVWRPAHPWSNQEGETQAREKAQQAAILALVPYASGYSGHQWIYRTNPSRFARQLRAEYRSRVYAQLYEQMAQQTDARNHLADSTFVRRKYRLAAAMTDVRLAPHINQFNYPLSTTVQFQIPLHIPYVGRILGTRHWSGEGFYREISATATLPLETPESATRTLGIGYDSSLLQ